MKILVISSHYERPGSFTGQPVHRLSQELAGRDLDVRVLCPLARFDRRLGWRNLARLYESGTSSRMDGIDVSYLPYANVPHRLAPGWDARSLFRSLSLSLAPNWRPDVVHAHRLFPTGHAAVGIARRLVSPLVVTAHGSDVHTHPTDRPRVLSRTREVVASADRVTAVSGELADRIMEMGDPREPVLTVHLGVDSERFRPQSDRSRVREALALPTEGPGIVSVSRLTKKKGVFDLLESFRAITDRHPGAWLAYVGDGPARAQLGESAVAQGIAHRVFLPGVIPNERIPDWLNAADIFVLASWAEGLPNVILEAMSCGLPVVATRVGGTDEAVSADSGILVSPRDVAGLARALDRLAGSADLSVRMGRAGLRQVRARFTWAHTADAYVSLYRELLAAQSATRTGDQ